MSQAIRPAAIRSAASLIICARKNIGDSAPSSAGNFRILTVKRNDSGSYASAHVFPGGKLEPVDTLPWRVHGAAEPNLDHRLAAIRESFEEVGFHGLLDSPPNSSPNFVQLRNQLNAGQINFQQLCTDHNLVPNVSKMVHWSSWITPPMISHRFNTQFYLTVADRSRQEILDLGSDGTEVVQLDWLSPKEAIDAFDRGDINLFLPQYYTLWELQRYSLEDLEALVAKISSRAVPPTFDPELQVEDTKRSFLALPGDYIHSSSPGSDGDRRNIHRAYFERHKGAFTKWSICRSDEELAKL
ncbi:uncharacterized protein BJ171DRAFT_511030 [Polychytrium aggregatum]|uniref:uncharacterized protein n=1 Tax=Polychytrium aggregatum TaxID=110093 RepID=UPI0022FE2E85|nr:uncharacterized protein BJ171DRAFT_511030 [Polychytrium aggregatum]KAI9203167.1 hypothetical protein BJ171DRAFT_511030 [Polychytrium aggregatum]